MRKSWEEKKMVFYYIERKNISSSEVRRLSKTISWYHGCIEDSITMVKNNSKIGFSFNCKDIYKMELIWLYNVGDNFVECKDVDEMIYYHDCLNMGLM